MDNAKQAKAFEDVCAERARQKDVLGWTPEHDDEHHGAELAKAALCYLQPDTGANIEGIVLRTYWPWDWSWWKPKDRRSDLVRAAALVIAEIERIDRAADAPTPNPIGDNQ